MNKSVFAADLRVYGDVASRDDLEVHGYVEGTVSVRDLVVARGATIEGRVRAASVEVAGRIRGRLDCDRVAIESSGCIEGDIAYKSLSMVAGGILNAHCVPSQGNVAAAEAEGVRASRPRPDRSDAAAVVPARAAVGAPV